MKNAFQDGRVLDVTLAADVASGGVVLQNRLLGIAVTNGKTGDTIAAHVEGVFTLPKLSTAVIAVGAPVTWDVSAGQIITGAPANGDLVGFGYAVEAAANPSPTVKVRLCPGAGAIHSA
ncbi:DUF2190 family protein [Luteimonas sp. Sa2BVA3]|uniref:DUF2190 family protein n=1 Tax=Luteimonas colneyensis TaxID=2762230 RepID=A0ABR8UHK4_9GAMM|nr:DUF2190 family protein [Luteimonas colneyensis]MBD7987119.1 DUF2190 family protein [Luteimonas colneyensis]